MLLSKIKLVGFKSFVDGTSILFPSRLVGIVGPNGCGKSNVIDAVRWVMGESSASRLRGEQGTDVIFNGSGGRQPLAQASVELFFDNSDASLGGEYAQYSEISIRRVVGRDAVSHYFLNGTRCRRKDIADIFLGTGLGPRSYAIIQQGTISRLIEAKPEDLRLMLEEAAGISKYKERRKETETRIRGARENLERLQDVRIELDKQLSTLQRQASAAERFKALKIEYRQAKSILLALRWKVVADNILHHQQKMLVQETELAQVMAEVRHIEGHIQQLRLKHTESLDLLNESQTDFYRQKNELAKIEQEIVFQSTRRDQLQQDLNGTISQWESLSTAIEHDSQQYQQRQETAKNLHPEYMLAHRDSESTAKELQELELLLTQSQQAWQLFREKISSASKTAEVEQAHIQQYEQRILMARNKLQKLDDSLKSIDASPHEEKIRALSDEIDSQRKTVESTQHSLLSSKDAVTLAQQKLRESSEALDRLKYQRQQFEGKRVSLEVLQKAALESHDQETKCWLSTHGFENNKRLAQSIQVLTGWEHAVETVLGDFLQAICIDEFSTEHAAHLFSDFQHSSLALISQHGISVKHAQRLVDKVQSDYCPDILHSIWAVDTLEEALALQSALQSHESVVTKDGLWLGPHWLRVTHKKDAGYGVLEREKELQAVVNDIQQTEKLLVHHQQRHDEERQQLRHQQTLVEDLQQQHQLLFSRLSQKEAELRVQKSLLDQLLSRRQSLSQELIENQHDIEQLKEKLAVSRDLWNQALEQLSHLQSEQAVLEKEKEEKTLAVQTARHHHQAIKQRFHDLTMKKNITDIEIKSLEKNIAQLEGQRLTLKERKKSLQDSLAQNDLPLSGLKEKKIVLLQSCLESEKQLGDQREALNLIEIEQRDSEKKLRDAQEKHMSLQLETQHIHVEIESSYVRQQTLEEQLQELDTTAQTVLMTIPEGKNISECEDQLAHIDRRIERLGPINLVAIDEYKEKEARKVYYDAQNADLENALTRLEEAMHKIDKETRAKFKETFESVNHSFSDLFPKIFGGGKAALELTHMDLLETGVDIIAQPPGKKNNSIHLLSGGEKTMVAIALVFSIFKLNPAPFCMLDEVDAPLDDANVIRFSELVREMSNSVQFIVITHNKVTMESLNQLMGVTMNEPGVSRIVSVDIKEAVELGAVE